ncbi:MAG TPA: IS66 family transposase [Pyrinomonadaceae bacterium]|nr:IS66 family transposase [Pyrinomonadaceae bacterium]
MLHLSTIRQHFDSGFSSVVSLVDDLEQQIEKLTFANQTPSHFQYLEQTISNQRQEIKRLTETIDNKSKQLFKLYQTNHQLQIQLQLRIAPTQPFINRLETQIEKLQLQLSSANQFNLQLQTKISELEKTLEFDTIPSIKLDSHNSSLPPSLDMPWCKPKQTQSLRKKSGHQVGGQLGHQGSTLLQVHHPDLVIVHQVNVCQHCHLSLTNIESIRFNKRQIFEIENGRLTVIEHQAEVKLCPFCRKISKGHFPDNLKAPVQYGTSVFSRIVYLNQYQLLPVARTAETMNDLFECPLSWATIKRATKSCADKLIRVELKIKAKLRDSAVLGVDETGININGVNNWVHVARSDEFTHFAFHVKRGKPAFEAIGIINQFTGTLVRDGFSAYKKYDQCHHSLCNAHLLRNLTFVSENEPKHKVWTTKLIKLLVKIKDTVQQAKLNGQTALISSQQSSYFRRYDTILTEAEQAIRGSPKRREIQLSSRHLYLRFLMNKKAILRFMTDFRVPFDNNGSERDLRMLKLYQKISGCFRTIEGVKVFCRIRSYLSSVRKQGRGLLNSIEHALNGKLCVLNN